jgi:hypothetical protein
MMILETGGVGVKKQHSAAENFLGPVGFMITSRPPTNVGRMITGVRIRHTKLVLYNV